jgi:DNA polymerase-1
VSKFPSVVVADFEYEVDDGELPNVLCMVAYVLNERLQHVRTHKLWRGEFGPAPPFDIGPDTLFVSYSAWAEMTCFQVLGWKFPKHIFDLHTAFLMASNVLLAYAPDETRKKPPKDLEAACRAYGVEGGWEGMNKKKIASDIGAENWAAYGRDGVIRYCEEDVRIETQLLKQQLDGWGQLRPADTELIMNLSDYSAKAAAQTQARGMLIDVPLWNKVQDNKLKVIEHLRREFDPSYGSDDPIYTPNGEWSYERFERYLQSIGVTEWPRLNHGEGMLDISSDAFKMMYFLPGMQNLHALRDSLGVIVRAKLPIGRDGRNRPSLFPLGTKSGRNAHAKSLFNAHAGMRSFIIFPEGVTAVYCDWRTQEVGVAAARSEDRALMAAYNSGDVYYGYARDLGLTTDPDIKHWKKTEADMRNRMKQLNFAITYWMSVGSLAKRLERHELIGSWLILKHKDKFGRCHEWQEQQVRNAMDERQIVSVHGWPLYLSSSPNKRTLCNFPMQSGGADMLRWATRHLCEAGIIPSMLVHDAVLIEMQDPRQIEEAREIMLAAGREVCGGFEIGVDIDVLGSRFRDKRDTAQRMWRTMMEALQEVGAIPRGEIP